MVSQSGGRFGPVFNLRCRSIRVINAAYAQNIAMASTFRKLLSFRLNSHNSDVVNSNEIRINDLIKAPSRDNFHE